MSNPIEASVHLAGQTAKVGWYTLVHELGSSYARRRTSAARSRDDVQQEPARSGRAKPSAGPSRSDVLQALRDLMVRDAALVRDGICPPLSDFPSSLPDMALRLRDMFADIPRAAERSAAEARHEVREDCDTSDLPDYYTQNFHYQTDGYLTSESARLYDVQVETLFSGTAGAMRRQALRPIAEAVAGRDQRSMALLDVACGTGRLMGQISQAFPALPQTGIDLSEAYLNEARAHLKGRRGIALQAANAETLPFEPATFDIVTCSFLFHELPGPVRRTVVDEISRVLRPGGTFVFIDSMQLGDAPKFDGMLEAFPERFHEPYYRNYLSDDLEGVFHDAGLVRSATWNAFFSKVMVRRRTGG
ncbi:MAG: class I SAM-dependent methyltransferase [Hyphomicrobiaceae bacterium]